jgi:hypothetical protein
MTDLTRSVGRPKRNPERCRLTVELADARRREKLERLRVLWGLDSISSVIRRLVDEAVEN